MKPRIMASPAVLHGLAITTYDMGLPSHDEASERVLANGGQSVTKILARKLVSNQHCVGSLCAAPLKRLLLLYVQHISQGVATLPCLHEHWQEAACQLRAMLLAVLTSQDNLMWHIEPGDFQNCCPWELAYDICLQGSDRHDLMLVPASGQVIDRQRQPVPNQEQYQEWLILGVSFWHSDGQLVRF